MNHNPLRNNVLSIAFAAGMAALASAPASAQSPSSASLAGLEQRVSPAQMQKAERLLQKAESGGLTPGQAARVRELEKRPGAGQARAEAEKALAARRQQQATASTKVGAGDTNRRVQDTSAAGVASSGNGLRAKPSSNGGSYQPGASPLGGGLPSGAGGSSSGSGLGAPAAWAKGR